MERFPVYFRFIGRPTDTLRFGRCVVALAFAAWVAAGVGCGSKTEPTAQGLANPEAIATASPSTASPSTAVASPTDVVSQFLDLVRRGGADSAANELLTTKARAELQRIGRTIQPIGSPETAYRVTRAEDVQGMPNSKLVLSIWSEPNTDGTTDDFEVAWALEREAAGWRISGLAMQLDPASDPMIIDFENGERMAQVLAEPESPETPAATQANTATDPALTR